MIRLNWKLNLISEIELSLTKSPVELSNNEKKNFLRIKTSGEIDYDKQIYLYNLNEEGKPGFEVINPITINTKNYLLNRGWITFDKKNSLEINNLDEQNIIGVLKKQNKANIFKPKMILKKIIGSH
jgi:surfeit locus 1 family protein